MKANFSDYEYKWLGNTEDLSACFEIRRKVFVEEQGVLDSIVFDDYDHPDHPDTLSLVVIDRKNTKPVASARLAFKNNLRKWYVQRVSVLKEERGKGLGDLLMELVEEKCKDLKIEELFVSSQFWIKQLYLKHGFEQVGDTYLEADILHITLKKKIF